MKKVIKVIVYYDDAHHVPSNEALLNSVDRSIQDGLLSPTENDETVEDYEVEIE